MYYVYPVHVYCLQPEEGVRYPETAVLSGGNYHVGAGTDPAAYTRATLLTTEPSGTLLKAQKTGFYFFGAL